MHKDQIKKIVDFYNNDGVVYYLLKIDDHQGYKEVYIEEREDDKIIYITKSIHIHTWDYLENCDITDFKFYKTVDLFKEDSEE